MELKKFLFASNSIDNPDSQYILHTEHPQALIEISARQPAEMYYLQNIFIPGAKRGSAAAFYFAHSADI